MTRTERQFAVWRMLTGATEGIGLKALSDRLGVSKNTIQRDIDELSRSGVAVEEEACGQKMNFRVRSVGTGPTRMQPRFLEALSAGTAALSPFRRSTVGQEFTAALTNLDPSSADVGPYVGPLVQGRRSCAPSVFSVLLEGIRSNRRVRIRYIKRVAEVAREHEVEPVELLLHDGLVFLRARAPHRNVMLVFAVDRISTAAVLATPFVPRKAKRTGFGVFQGKPERVEVRFHPDIAPFIAERQWHPTQRLRGEEDGTLVFSARLSGMYEFIGWVMSWGHRAELMKPTAWRDEALLRAQAMFESYASTTPLRPST